MKHKNYCVVCDGGKRSGMTYGSFALFDLNGVQVEHHFMIFGFGTSLEAEFIALLNAVDLCIDRGYKRVIFKTDSMEMIKHLNGTSDTKKQQLRALSKWINGRLKKLEFYQLIKVPRKDIKKVLGH